MRQKAAPIIGDEADWEPATPPLERVGEDARPKRKWATELRPNADGSFDEFVVEGQVHFEMMDDNHLWVGIYPHDVPFDCRWTLDISIEGGKLSVVADYDGEGAATPAAPDRVVDALRPSARDVIAERERQISREGWTVEHDDRHATGELARAAAAYARHAGSDEDTRQVNSGFSPEDLWPWIGFWKPSNRRRDLVKAGALILAEIDRLDRAALQGAGDGVGEV